MRSRQGTCRNGSDRHPKQVSPLYRILGQIEPALRLDQSAGRGSANCGDGRQDAQQSQQDQHGVLNRGGTVFTSQEP
jgi:hypothetical protein